MPIKMNPIIEALDGINENTAISAAPQKRRMKTPLKIVIISVAAVVLLGTTAAAATLGEHPIVKINNKTVTPSYSSYVNDDGWTLKTTVVKYPVDCAGYEPVGEIRAVYDENCEDKTDDVHYFDELGVMIDNISKQLAIYLKATKEGEIDIHSMNGTGFFDYHQSESMDSDGNNIQIEFWQDPIQVARQVILEKRFAKMSIDEKIEYQLMYGWDIGYPEYGGFQHPSMRDIFSADTNAWYGRSDVINYKGLPGDVAAGYYGYTLDQPEGFTEKDGVQVIMIFNTHYVPDENFPQINRTVADKVIQQMFIYTLTDNASGKDVKFTVWRSAEEKDVDTSCFKFDYEYIPLKNGTEARLHQSGYSNYIVEFEKDGAAYAAVTDLDMELVERMLINLNLL